MRRTLLSAAVAVSVGAAVLAPAATGSPLEPPRDQWYASNEAQDGRGHWSTGDRVRVDEACLALPAEEQGECSLDALQRKSHVVVAFVDSGINPYAQDFRAPEYVHHPSTYVEGFPADAAELALSLDVADDEGYAAAREADDATWQGVKSNRLHWIPGTRIIGGLSLRAGGTGLGSWPERPLLDDNGHGTGVASVAAGRWYGSNPDALIVMVEGLGFAGVEWAAAQPWIDVVSNSWGPGLPGRVDIPDRAATDATKAAVEAGKSILFSSGNGMRNTNSSTVPFPAGTDPCRCKIPTHNLTPTANGSGPSWHLTVGAVSPVNGQPHWWHGVPVDVASFGSKWRAAAADGVQLADNRDFGGTSCATPITAGVLSAVVQRAREALGDVTEGQEPDGVVAAGPARGGDGPLADGALTRTEAERLLVTSAQPHEASPEELTWDYAVEPTTDAYWVQQGYGVVDAGAKERALETLLGVTPFADRADVDAWMETTDAARDAYYDNP
ncbi:MAG: S8 family serine peptidase [Actinomycetes bacterium]